MPAAKGEARKPGSRNGGLRKRCACPRRKWAKCPHGWHLNFKWKGVHHRLSIDREIGEAVTSRTEAEIKAGDLRTAIRNGTFRAPAVQPVEQPTLTFRAF